MTRRTRRSFVTIHQGHLADEYQELDRDVALALYWEELKKIDFKDYRAGAFSLERGEERGRLHINAYVERKNAATWATYGREFSCSAQSFETVISPESSWFYCTGQDGEKAGVEELYEFGTPALYGGSEQKADLKWCVGQITGGSHPSAILKENPYAYTVHADRIWRLWRDLQYLEKHGTLVHPKRMQSHLQ
jgi:hypothetical protein